MGTEGFIWFQGVVEDRDDPLKLGRVRVRCLGWHNQENSTKFEPRYVLTEDLPWAHVMLPINYNQNTVGPRLGDWVMGFFRDGLEAQEPFILGIIPHIPQELPKDEPLGFEDPSRTYPKDPADWPTARNNWVSEPRTNRLARPENIAETTVQLKRDTLTTGVSTASGATWDEPDPSHASQYPLNRVEESESGHIREVDDTPGAERIAEYHRAGTFFEIDADGNKVTRVVGDKYEIVAGTDYVNIKGDANLTVNGTLNLKAKNLNIDVEENLTETIGGNQTTTAGGNIDIDASRIDLN